MDSAALDVTVATGFIAGSCACCISRAISRKKKRLLLTDPLYVDGYGLIRYAKDNPVGKSLNLKGLKGMWPQDESPIGKNCLCNVTTAQAGKGNVIVRLDFFENSCIAPGNNRSHFFFGVVYSFCVVCNCRSKANNLREWR